MNDRFTTLVEGEWLRCMLQPTPGLMKYPFLQEHKEIVIRTPQHEEVSVIWLIDDLQFDVWPDIPREHRCLFPMKQVLRIPCS